MFLVIAVATTLLISGFLFFLGMHLMKKLDHIWRSEKTARISRGKSCNETFL